MRDTIDMAREAGGRAQQNKNCDVEYLMSDDAIKVFAQLVPADERELLAKLQFERLLQAIRIEREACAMVCETFDQREAFNDEDMAVANACAAAIRARSQA